ncbi:MAG: nucleoside hydrolase [Oscillospiraceae bacterium]|nr:nucleoside hydrolase [Oscillospiraceae bacterium]
MAGRPLIIDTDSGHGFAEALMLIDGCGLFDIKGVCTVFGSASPRRGAAHAAYLRELCGGQWPIVTGSERPLVVRRKDTGTKSDCAVLDELAPAAAEKVPAPEHPWDLIYRTAVEQNGELELFCTGPLTNIAVSVIRHRDLPKYIKKITIAGGASRRGDATPYAEFNIYSDPHAFKCILDAGFSQIDLVDLEFCRYAHLTAEEAKNIGMLSSGNPWKSLLEKTVTAGNPRNKELTGLLELDSAGSVICHDAAAAFVLAIPAAVTATGVYTMVEQRSELSSGRTLFDFGKRFTDGPNVRLATYTTREMYSDFYIRCLRSYDRRVLR